jgi:transposase InsO family protein
LGVVGGRGVQISGAEPGEPRQNGHAERLMRAFKEEEVARADFRDFADAWARMGRFLNDVCQHQRIHSALGYLAPAEFEAAYHTRLLSPVTLP